MDQSAFQNAVNEERQKRSSDPFKSALDDIRQKRREAQLAGGQEGTLASKALAYGKFITSGLVELGTATPGPVIRELMTSGIPSPERAAAISGVSGEEVAQTVQARKGAAGIASEIAYGVNTSGYAGVANALQGAAMAVAPSTPVEAFARGMQKASQSQVDTFTTKATAAATEGYTSLLTLMTTGPVVGSVSFFAKGAGAADQQYTDAFVRGQLEGSETDRLSQRDRYVAALTGGAIESATELVGGKLITGTVGRALRPLSKPVSGPVLNWARTTAAGAAIEGGEEFLATTLQEQVATRLTKEKTPTLKQTALNATSDFMYGMIGGVSGTLTAVPIEMANRSEEVRRLDRSLRKSETEFADPNFWDKMTAGRVRSLIPMTQDERMAEAEKQREAALVGRATFGSATAAHKALVEDRKKKADDLKKAQKRKDASGIKTAEDSIADLTSKIDSSQANLDVLAADAKAAEISYVATVSFIARNAAQVQLSVDDVLRQNNATTAQATTEADNKASSELQRLGYDVQFYDGGQSEQVGFYDPASPNTIFLRSGQTNAAEAIGIGYEEAIHGIQFSDAGLWKAIRQMHSTSAAVDAAANYFNQQSNPEDIAARGAIDAMGNPQQGPVTAERAIANRFGSTLVTAEGVANDIRDGVQTLFRTGQAPGLLGQIITRMGLRGRQAATALRVRNMMLERAASRQRGGLSEFGQQVQEAKAGIQARVGLEQEAARRAAAPAPAPAPTPAPAPAVAASAPATTATTTTTAAAPAMPAPGSISARAKRESDIGHKREKETGRYVGAPDWVGGDPAKLRVLRNRLRQLAKEGEVGKEWYERSSKAILDAVGGNIVEAEKIVALIAIYSPNATVAANTTMALTAYYQFKAGQEIKAGLGASNKKAMDLLSKNERWSGIKTNSFYQNLMVEIDPSYLDTNVATMDMWMALAFDYGDKALDQGPKYKFSEREIQRLAEELGWKPHQVQAAIWTAMKGRVDPIRADLKQEELKRGIGEMIEETDPETGKVSTKYSVKSGREREHFKLAYEMAMSRESDAAALNASKYDFSDAINERLIQLSWEATPSTSANAPLPGIHSAPLEQKIEYLNAVASVLNQGGRDRIAELAGIPQGRTITGISAWDAAIGVGAQTFIPAPLEGAGSRRAIKPIAESLIRLAAAIRGYVLNQDAVFYHTPMFDSAVKSQNGIQLLTQRGLTDAEMRQLYDALNAKFNTWELAPGYLDRGVRILNFVDGLDNKSFHKGFDEIVESLPDDFGGGVVEYGTYRSIGGGVFSNWKDNPNGEGYKDLITARSPDLLRRVDDLRSDVEAVNRRFASKYGWGERRLAARDRGELGIGVERAAAGTLSPLAGAPRINGFTGPDPAIVSIAERYAAERGIPFRRQAEYAEVDTKRAERIAAAYDAMRHDPADPKVAKAYKELIDQTRAQYDALVAGGYQFYFFDQSNDPYSNQPGGFGNPYNAVRDLRANKRMAVYPTESGFGSGVTDVDVSNSPLLADTGLQWPLGSPTGQLKRVTANDLFRAVHDAFGHSLEGAGFRARGEENAWQAHVRLFTGDAVGAMTSETRGQNSWLNFGPFGSKNQTAKIEDTTFADQKVGLMPSWTWTEGVVSDEPVNRALAARQNRVDNASSDQVDTRTMPAEFYSALDRAIAGLPEKSMKPDGWMQMMTGFINKGIIKKDEYFWSGLQQMLELQKAEQPDTSLTKADLDGMTAMGIVVSKRTLIEPTELAMKKYLPPGYSVLETDEGGEYGVDGPEYGLSIEPTLQSAVSEAWQHYNALRIAGKQQPEVPPETPQPTRYGPNVFKTQTLPNAKNYRENILVVQRELRPSISAKVVYEPMINGFETKRPWTVVIDGETALRFETSGEADKGLQRELEASRQENAFSKSHHEGVGGEVLLHYRTTDRDVGGKKYLFIEELQSDWAQQGRKVGFKESITKSKEQVQKEVDDARRVVAIAGKELMSVFASEATSVREDIIGFIDGRFMADVVDSPELMVEKLRRKFLSVNIVDAAPQITAYMNAKTALKNASNVRETKEAGRPTGPFVTATDPWVTLGLKQILMQAVNEGYDGVAFINGTQEAKRNEQIIPINVITYAPIGGGLYSVYADGERYPNFSINDIRSELGSTVAEMIEKNEGEDQGNDVRLLDLRGKNIGAESMQRFYEGIVPLNLKKLLKKLGGPELTTIKLENIPDPQDQIALDITDTLEANVRKGLSLFARSREQRQESLAFQMGRRSGQVAGMMKGREQGIREGKEEQRRKEVIRRAAMRAKFAERVAGFEQRIENAAQTNADLRARLGEAKAAAVEKRADIMDRARARVLKAWFAGQQKGSEAGYKQAKKDMVAMRKEALSIIKLLPPSMRGAYGNALATMKTVAGIDRIARRVVQDLATADAVDMVSAINRMDKRANKIGLRNDTREAIVSMLGSARGLLASGRNRLLPFTDTADLAARTVAAGDLLERAAAMFDQERAEYRMERDARAAEFEQDAGDLSATLAGKKGLPPERLASQAPRRGVFAQLFANNGNMDMYTIMERLEGTANGVLNKLWSGLLAGKDAMLKDRRDLDSRIDQALRRAGYDGYDGYAARAAGLYGDATAETVEVKIGGEMRRITVDQMMHLAALDNDTVSMLMDETDPERPSSPIVFATYRYEQPLYFTKQEHEALMASLTPRQAALISELKAILESSVQPRVFEIHFQQQGKQPPRVEGYFPRSRLSDEVGGEAIDPNMQPGQVVNTMLDNAGFLQKRVRSSAPLVIGGMMRTFDGHIDEALRLIHLAIPLRHAMTVLRRRGVRANIERIMGRGSNDSVRMLVLNGVGLSGKPRGDLVETVNSNISGALITINPKTWLRQLGGAFRLLTEFDSSHWSIGMARSLALTPSQRSQQIAQIEAVNGYFFERHRRSQVGLFANVLGDPRTGREQFSNGMRAVGRALATAGQDAAAGRWLQAANDVRQGLIGVGRVLRAADFALRGIDRQIMLVAYNSAIAQLQATNPGMPNMEEAAAVLAEKAFRKTQNVSDPLDDTMYAAQQKFSRGLGRFMFPFSSDPLKAYNQLRRAYASGDATRIAKSTTAVTGNILAGAAVNPLWAAAGLAIASAFSSGDDDEVIAEMLAEKEKNAAARKIASEVMSAAFGNAGLLASGIIEAAVGDPRMAEDVGEPLAVRALGDFSTAMAGGQYGRAASVAGQMAGIPVIAPFSAVTSTMAAVQPEDAKLLTEYRKRRKAGTLNPQQLRRLQVLEQSERLRKLREQPVQ